MNEIKINVTDPSSLQTLLATDKVIKNAVDKVSVMQSSPESVLNKQVDIKKRIKITQQLIDEAYGKLRVIVNNKKVSTKNIAVMIAYAMQLANEMLQTSKTYKVELALAIIRQLINDEVSDPNTRAVIHSLVEITVPHLLSSIDDLPNLIQKLQCCCCKKK